MRPLLLPTLRADVRMHEEYVAGGDGLLDVPITSIRGADDQLVSAAEASRWREVTSGRFRLAEVAGGRMYLTGLPAPLLGFVDETLEASCPA